ncbi:hypothetical protein [Streptomyces sp. BBFR102]|uniref:hypothetical protein n=1 Tax=Streptomyces sp. BBFR102 TaxID=3448171 RepID=UPI003F53068B
MSGLRLFLRSRRVPGAVGGAVAATFLTWLLTAASAGAGEVGGIVIALTVLLLVTALTVTLGGQDDRLDRTAARRWGVLRMLHLTAILGCVLALLVVTLFTATRFGPFGAVVRDTVGLLGLTALGAVAAGTARSWFLPLGWTLGAAAFQGTGTAAEVLAWQTQAADSRPAAVVAGVLAVVGFAAYVSRGPLPRTSAENV